MNPQQFRMIQAWFDTYVSSYTENNGQPSPYQLKVEHSHRVATEARDLARDLGWPEADVTLARAIGLLHDVGRFSQFARFGTFRDAESVNHGTYGAEVLQGAGLLTELDVDTRTSIRDGVSYHNAKIIPDRLTERGRVFVHMIRDADKLDIFRIVQTKIQRDGFRELARMLPRIRLDGPVSAQMVRDFQAGACCPIQHVTSLADHLLLQLSWIYDINYTPTFRRIVERDIIGQIAEYLVAENPAVRTLVADAEHYVRSCLAS